MILRLWLILLLALPISGCSSIPKGSLASAGLKNFDRVNPQLFRGAQPDEQGYAKLASMGVHTVINLRMPGDGDPKEEQRVRAAGMNYQPVPLHGYKAPTHEQIEKIMMLIENAPGPVFVHCRRGADRTGTVVACYRIRHDGWTTAQSLAEAEAHDMSWLQFGMKNFIRKFDIKSR
jgi:tyrosine-protein phosphatase SIW14